MSVKYSLYTTFWLKRKRKILKHYKNKSKKKYHKWTQVIIEYFNAKTHVYTIEKNKVCFTVV